MHESYISKGMELDLPPRRQKSPFLPSIKIESFPGLNVFAGHFLQVANADECCFSYLEPLKLKSKYSP